MSRSGFFAGGVSRGIEPFIGPATNVFLQGKQLEIQQQQQQAQLQRDQRQKFQEIIDSGLKTIEQNAKNFQSQEQLSQFVDTMFQSFASLTANASQVFNEPNLVNDVQARFESAKSLPTAQQIGRAKLAGETRAIQTPEGPEFVTAAEAIGQPPVPRKPLVQIGGELPFKVPSGFMLKDPNDPSKGLTAIPGGPADISATETAAKTQMLRIAEKQLPLVKSLIFNEDGTPNFKNIASAQVNLPKTEGRKLAAAMEVGIQAIARLETGAEMPPGEVQNTRKRFQPSVLDDADIIELKLQMYEDFVSGTLQLLDPSGKFDENRFNMEFANRLTNQAQRKQQSTETSDDLQQLLQFMTPEERALFQ